MVVIEVGLTVVKVMTMIVGTVVVSKTRYQGELEDMAQELEAGGVEDHAAVLTR